MDSLTGEFAHRTEDLAPEPADVPLYTTALDDPRSHAPRGPDYWVANLRRHVRFAAAVTAAADDGHRLFLEVAPHPVVSHSIAETLLHSGIEEHAVIPVLRRDQPESRAVALAIASLWCNGDEIVGDVAPSDPWACDLPGTQWEHRRFWREPTPPPGGRGLHDPASHTVLGGRTVVAGAKDTWLWETRLDMASRPYPGDHPVQGTEIVPAAVLLNTFLTAARGGEVGAGPLECTGIGLAGRPVANPCPTPGDTPAISRWCCRDRELTLASRACRNSMGVADGGWLTHSSAVAAVRDDIDELLETSRSRGRAALDEPLAPRHVVDTLAALASRPWVSAGDRELRRGDGDCWVLVGGGRRIGPDPSAVAG